MSELHFDHLVVTGEIEALPEGALQKLTDTFAAVWPKIWERFGKGEMPEIEYKIKTHRGIAYTDGHHIGLNPGWLVDHPEDIDCMTHELIHAAQCYPKYDPSWLVEAIADYGRGVYGLYNTEANWKLPEKYKGGKLQDGYRTAAAFLVWIEGKYDPEITDVCNRELQEDTYTPELWVKRTGKTVEALWEEYTRDGADA